MTAKQCTLAAIRSLVDYVKEDDRDAYLEQRAIGGGERHIYETIAQIEQWLGGQPQVLYLVGGSDGGSGLPEAFCDILTEQQAVERFEDLLRGEQLPLLPYNPKADRVEVSFEPSDALGQMFYCFMPLGGVYGDMTHWLSFECRGKPLDCWRIVINGKVVYEESDEEEAALVSEAGNSEEVQSSVSTGG